MARPFRLFSSYDFFSVLIPGTAALFSLYLLLPQEIQIPFPASIVFAIVASFVFGQALHSTAVLVEAIITQCDYINSHRQIFVSELRSPSFIADDIRDKFISEYARRIGLNDFQRPIQDGYPSECQAKALYNLAQSDVYVEGSGRSENFQSIYALCRSLAVLFAGLLLLYELHYRLRSSGLIFDRLPKYLSYFPSHGDFAEAIYTLCILGAAIFVYSTIKYKKFLVQYLFSDSLAIAEYRQ